MSARNLKAERLRRRADKLAVKIVSLVSEAVDNSGTLGAYEGIETSRQIREMLIKFFNSARRDGLRY